MVLAPTLKPAPGAARIDLCSQILSFGSDEGGIMSQTAPARSPWIEDAWRDLRFGFRAAEPCPQRAGDRRPGPRPAALWRALLLRGFRLESLAWTPPGRRCRAAGRHGITSAAKRGGGGQCGSVETPQSVVRNLTGSRNVGASPTSQVPISTPSGQTVQTVHSRAGRFAVTEKERRPDVSGPGRVSANGLGTSLQRSTGA
jgi:hypothetical protein